MILRALSTSGLRSGAAAMLPAVHHLSKALPLLLDRSVSALPVAVESTPVVGPLDVLDRRTHSLPEQQEAPNQNRELTRYSTHFPDALYGHLAALVASRPFPVAVNMSCAQQGPAGSELGRRGFCVAEACRCTPPLGRSSAHRLPGGCTDVVTLLPGPRDLHAPQLLTEAQRLMASGGFLAVAWNDRDLSSPFVSDLESLLEHINPHYCRSSRQHSPPAVASALSGGGALSLHSYAAWAHSLSMAKAGVLQDLLGGFEVVRPYLAASSTHRKAFHQAVRALVRHHFGDEEAPFELPLTAKLFVMKHSSPTAATQAVSASASTAVAAATAAGQVCPTATDSASSSTDSSSSGGGGECGCGCGPDDGCMTHHVRTRRSGLSSRDSCTLRHLYT